jgi:ribosomal protein S27AE
MKRQAKCQGCGNLFFSPVVKVYVFKNRLCPKCKLPLHISGNIYSCEKCNVTINKEIQKEEYVMLGVTLLGTSRNIQEVNKRREDPTIEADRMLIDSKTLCQRCVNFMNRFNDRQKPSFDKKAEIKVISPEDSASQLRQTINRRINSDYQAKMKQEEQKKLEEARIQEEKKAAEEKAKTLNELTT